METKMNTVRITKRVPFAKDVIINGEIRVRAHCVKCEFYHLVKKEESVDYHDTIYILHMLDK